LLITGANAVIPSATLTVSDGTLDFHNATVLSSIGTLLMGAGGNSAAYIKMGSGGMALAGNATFSAGSSTNPSQPGIITGQAGAVFTLNGSQQTFTIGQILTTTGIVGQDVTVSVPMNITGTMVKSGTGELVLSGSNVVNGTINVNNGT